MKIQLILGAAALALASCGSSGEEKAGEGSNGSAPAAQSGGGDSAGSDSAGSGGAVSLQPGEWEIKMELVNVKVEGLPEGVADGMKSQAGGISRTCMTPEEAKAPKGDMFAGDQSGSCKSEGFKWEGGRIDGKMTCAGQGGTGQTVMTMDGSYSPQSIDMTTKSETEMMGKAMTMEMRISGKRVGECTAATKEG